MPKKYREEQKMFAYNNITETTNKTLTIKSSELYLNDDLPLQNPLTVDLSPLNPLIPVTNDKVANDTVTDDPPTPDPPVPVPALFTASIEHTFIQRCEVFENLIPILMVNSIFYFLVFIIWCIMVSFIYKNNSFPL